MYSKKLIQLCALDELFINFFCRADRAISPPPLILPPSLPPRVHAQSNYTDISHLSGILLPVRSMGSTAAKRRFSYIEYNIHSMCAQPKAHLLSAVHVYKYRDFLFRMGAFMLDFSSVKLIEPT